MEKVQLWFHSGDRREGFRWSAAYQSKMVGLCRQPFCKICNLDEWESLMGFRGGRLEVQLTLHRRPSFWDWETKEFYIGHLLKVLPGEMAVDEGLEFDISRLNTIVCFTLSGAILIDPGSMGFDSREFSLVQLTTQRILATIITHGHLDHWNHLGLSETRKPIFMTKLTHELASRHAAWQRDGRLSRALRETRLVVPGDPILLDGLPLKIDTFSLPHSIPETMGLVVRGQGGRLVCLGDFKLNGMEPRQKAETIAILSRIAREPVDFLSLNIISAHLEGFVPLEVSVIDGLINIMASARGRVIVACFSTNLERIQRIAEAVQILGRPVAFCGAGMKNAQEFLGIKAEEAAVEDDKAMIFVTGCQAEENSVLWRIAQGQNPSFELRPDDTLVFSSRCIPGDEEGIRHLLGQLGPKIERIVVDKGEIERLGLADLRVDEAVTHVSGHGNKEDLRLALEILKPKKVLPLPQTEPQFSAFKEIANGIEIIDEEKRTIEI